MDWKETRMDLEEEFRQLFSEVRDETKNRNQKNGVNGWDVFSPPK